MNKQAIEKMYADKKAYVEVTLADMLRPFDNFGGVKYARDPRTNEEYVKVTEANGFPWFICVTGNSESAIGKEVCRMVTGEQPVGLVKAYVSQTAINKAMFGGA